MKVHVCRNAMLDFGVGGLLVCLPKDKASLFCNEIEVYIYHVRTYIVCMYTPSLYAILYTYACYNYSLLVHVQCVQSNSVHLKCFYVMI